MILRRAFYKGYTETIEFIVESMIIDINDNRVKGIRLSNVTKETKEFCDVLDLQKYLESMIEERGYYKDFGDIEVITFSDNVLLIKKEVQ